MGLPRAQRGSPRDATSWKHLAGTRSQTDLLLHPFPVSSPGLGSERLKPLLPHLLPAHRTPVFTQSTGSDALCRTHTTREGGWGRIILLEGRLRVRILGADTEEHVLTPKRPGVIEPTVAHEGEPIGPVRFFIELLRATPPLTVPPVSRAVQGERPGRHRGPVTSRRHGTAALSHPGLTGRRARSGPTGARARVRLSRTDFERT